MLRVEEGLSEVEKAMKEYRASQGYNDVKRKEMLDELNDRLVVTVNGGDGAHVRRAEKIIRDV